MRDGSNRCEAHKVAAWIKKPTAVKRITGRKLQRLRAELFARDPLCAECKRLGIVRLATQRDHILSLEEGGEDVEENVQGLCFEHHEEKSKAERLRAQARGRTD